MSKQVDYVPPHAILFANCLQLITNNMSVKMLGIEARASSMLDKWSTHETISEITNKVFKWKKLRVNQNRYVKTICWHIRAL